MRPAWQTYARAMTSSGESRKVGQLRNDVDDIYDMLGGINTTLDQHTATLDQHTATLDQHTATLDQHTAILNEHSAVLTEHTMTLTEHGTKLDQIIEILQK